MLKRLGVFLILTVFVVSLSGCATARKQKDLEIQRLNTQVSVLQSQLQNKDEEIDSLRDELNRIAQEKAAQAARTGKKKVVGEVKSRPTAKHIQTALKNAGYYTGSIDGRIGRQTKEAIKDFQRANNLAVDGKVGKNTWALLRQYLYKKIK